MTAFQLVSCIAVVVIGGIVAACLFLDINRTDSDEED